MKDAATVAQNWATRLGQSTQQIIDGVNAVQTAPGIAAARQSAVWLQNTQAAQKKWQTRVAAVPLGDWQTAMTQKGIPRIATGATAAVPKMTTFMNKLLPFVNSAVQGLPARGDSEANINRMVAFTRKMLTFSNA